ncbi:MAG: SagB/ThcOx family dehydrogenase [Desulfatibacillum sp.]|nr:SagB/ThcOx family dehydrogenase [Desulfatibacillum sp.]
MDGVGDRFQKDTKYQRGSLPGGSLDFSTRPKQYKEYAGAQRIALDPPKPRLIAPLDLCIRTRRSVRRFASKTVSFQDLSYLAWATGGIQRIEGNHPFRTAPSAGALYPIETYLVVKNAEKVPPGLYHYFPLEHSLELMKDGDFSSHATRAALDQNMCMSAAVTFFFTAVWERSKWKYKQRAYRYIYLDAGHMGQNLALAAAGLGLGTCAIGAIYDEEADALLQLDSEEEGTIMMVVAGYPVKDGR